MTITEPGFVLAAAYICFCSGFSFLIFFLLFLSIKAQPFVSFVPAQAKACADVLWK